MNMLRPARAPFFLALLLPVLAFLAARPAVAQTYSDFYTVDPCRVYDSRGNGGPLNQETTYTVPVAGVCGIPANARAVSLNVTIVGATGSGELKVFAAGDPIPSAAALSFTMGRTRALFSPVLLGTGGAVDAYATMSPTSPGLYQLVLDVTGYFLDSPPVAVDDNYPAEKDTVLNVSAPGVTGNDTLNGAAIVSYGASTGAEQTTIGTATPTSAGGSVSLNADGSFSYTPPTGAIGIDDTFKYVLQNPGGTSTATVTIPVGKANQTISFTSTAPTDAKVGGATYTVTATATSGLTVTFTIDALASSVCTIAGSTVSFIGAGTCVINANQAGDTNYNPAPQVQQSFPVAKGDQTISFTSTAPSDAKVGGPTYNVTATATSGLTVAFTIDASAASVCTIAGSTVSFLGVGTCVINANQAGDANWNPAPQVQQSFAVGKGDQTITFTSTAPADAAVNGPTYNVTATASSGLPVTFTIDASATSVCSISGSTVSFTAAGTCVINANQAGNANYNPAPQVQQSFPVSLASQTISFTSTAPADAKVGGPTYNVTATATSGLTVTFTIDASASTVCTIAGSTVSFIGAGTCVINANQAGDASYSAAPQEQQSFPVAKGDQTITFTSTAPADAKVGGATYNVTATATSGLAVSFTIDASASTVCSISGSTVSFIGAGTCVINANQAGDANWNAAPQVQQSFPVAKGDQTISFTSTAPVGAKVGGATYNVTATATSGLPVTFTIDASASTVCSISGSTVSFIGAGTCVINANQAGNANYNAAPQVQQSFAVAKGDQTISFTSTPPVGATVSGPTYTVSATATSGLAVIFTIDASASSVCTISGSTVSFIGGGTCVINANQPGDANWNAAPQVQQSFTVVKQDQTISFTSAAPVGATVSGPTYTVTATATSGLPVTFTIDASAASVCTIAGSTVSFIGAGTCVINANQAGNTAYNPAPQVQQSFLVVKQDQTITFTSTPPALASIGGTYTVTATATSGLAVTFTIDASSSSVCTISGSTVSFIGGGTCVINANQAGNFAYNPAPQVQQSVQVNFPPQFTTNPVTYTTPGNTQLHVAGATLPGVASKADASGLLAKSGASDPDSIPGPLSVVAASGTTANGGSYSIDAAGTFTYVPAAGFSGTDSFTFQVTDTLDARTGTVNITVGTRVWYIHDVVGGDNPAGGDGRSTNPFDTVTAFNAATTFDNDIIFIFEGNTGTTPHTGSITLKNGQKLHGHGVGLTVPSHGTLIAAGNRPRLRTTAASTNVVSVPATAGSRSDVEIRGLDLEATGGSIGAGNASNAIDVTASGANTVGITINNNHIRGATGEGIDLNANGTGIFTAAVQNNTWELTGSHLGNSFDARTGIAGANLRVDFSNNTNLLSTGAGATAVYIDGSGGGTATVTGFANNWVHQNTVGNGIQVVTATFDANPATAGFQQVVGGTMIVGTSGDGVGSSGVTLVNVSGDLAFSNFNIFASGNNGLQISGTGAFTGAAGTRVTVGAGVGIVEAPNSAVNLSSLTADLQLATVKSTNTTSTGVSLTNVSDGGGTNAIFSAGSGSSIVAAAGATGPAFNVSGGNAAITFPGAITNNSTSARAVSIDGWSGDDAGDDILLSGAIDENGAGILVSNNSGTSRSITFSGGMDIDTTTGEGFAATSNSNTGGLHITGTNDITSTSATALRVTSTTIGSSNLNFRNVSSGNNTAAADPANGIVLSATGTLGRLIITGTGASGQGGNSTGGLIQNTTSHGISLTDTTNPSFTNMSIQGTGGSGINGTLVAGFTFDNGTINNSGTAGGADDSNISFNDSSASANVSGTVTVTDSVLTNSRFHGIDIQHYNGTIAHADIQNNAFTSAASIATSLGSAIRLDAYGAGATVGNVTRATINNNVITNFPTGAGIHAFGGNSSGSGPAGTFGVAGSGTDVIAVTNNLMNGGSLGVGNQPDRFFTGGITGSGQGNFNIFGNGTAANPITNIDGVVIELNQFGTGSMTATVNNNRIVANNAVGSAGINVGCDADATAALDNAVVSATISGNNVSDTDGPGIFAIARGSNCSLTTRILSNTVAAPDTTTAARAGIRVDSGSAAGDTTLCLEISGNTTAGSTNTATATTSPGINLRKQGTSTADNIFGIEGLSPSPTGTPNVENHVNGLNTSSSGTFGVNGTALLSATSGFTSCVAP